MRLPALFTPRDGKHEAQLAHALRRVPLFAELPVQDVVRLWRHVQEVRVEAGDVVFSRGEAGDRFFIVKAGTVEVCLSLVPERIVVSRLGPGDSFGEMALLTGAPRAATILAAEDVVLWSLERREFESLVAGSVPLLRALNRELCERLRRTNEQVEALRLRTAGASGGGALRFGSYQAQEQIGAGGMAVVYRAVHSETAEEVAVKVLPGAWGDAPEMRARLEREARILARLDHPNVVRVREVGTIGDALALSDGVETSAGIAPQLSGAVGGGTYVAMELLPRSLGRLMRANYPAPLPLERALRTVIAVAEALDAVHALGVVHRDVKPGNILLREDGTPVLTDFGLAVIASAAAEQRLTAENVIIGTPDYMAPEQVAGLPVDGRADIYSLGVVLYEMLSGHVPFAGRDPYETFQAHVEEAPPPLPESVHPLIRAIVERVLQKRPADRFPSAGSFARALRLALAAVLAEREGPAEAGDDLDWLMSEAGIGAGAGGRPTGTMLDELQPTLVAA